MEIRLVTVEKKLTKALINQMPQAGLRQLNHGIVLGFLLNVVKDISKVMLIEYEDEYYLHALDWKLGNISKLYRKNG